jgi:hypothetical protein
MIAAVTVMEKMRNPNAICRKNKMNDFLGDLVVDRIWVLQMGSCGFSSCENGNVQNFGLHKGREFVHWPSDCASWS